MMAPQSGPRWERPIFPTPASDDLGDIIYANRLKLELTQADQIVTQAEQVAPAPFLRRPRL